MSEYDEGRPGERAASNVIDPDKARLRAVQRRVLQEAVSDGSRRFWLRRAQDFENAKPRLGEFHGKATPEELNARWTWCDQVARACRAKANMATLDDELYELLSDLGGAA